MSLNQPQFNNKGLCILSLLFISTLVGCMKDEPCYQSFVKIEVETLNTFDLNVSKDVYHFTSGGYIDKEDSLLVFGFNGAENMVTIYDLLNGKVKTSFNIPTTGPEAMQGIVDNISYSGNNEFLCYSTMTGEIKKYSDQGTLIRNYSADSLNMMVIPQIIKKGGYAYAASYAPHQNFYVTKNDLLVINLEVEFPPSSDISPYEDGHLLIYDLKSEGFQILGDFPDVYNTSINEYYSSDPTIFVYNDDKIVVSFQFSHVLQVFEQVDGNWVKSSACAQSNFISEYSIAEANDSDKKYIEAVHSGSYYKQLIFDQFKNTYYRIIKHQERGLDENGLTKIFKEADWSILILDKDLNYIGETEAFQGGKYDYDQIFVSPKGLIISLENDFNLENQEDVLSFELIKLNTQ